MSQQQQQQFNSKMVSIIIIIIELHEKRRALMCPIYWFVLYLLEIFRFSILCLVDAADKHSFKNYHVDAFMEVRKKATIATAITIRPTDTNTQSRPVRYMWVKSRVFFYKLSIFRLHERAMCSFLCEHMSRSEIYDKIRREIFMHFF